MKITEILILVGILALIIPIAYKIGKYKWSSGKNFIKIEIIALVVLVSMFILSNMMSSNENIDKIKNSELYGFEGITIGEVFDKSLKNVKWDIEEDENNMNIIAEGDSPNGAIRYKVIFIMTDKETYVGSVSINGNGQEALIAYGAIVTLYDEAGYISEDNHNRAFDYLSNNGALPCINSGQQIEDNSSPVEGETSEEEQSQDVDEEQEGVNEYGDGNIEADYLDSVLKQCGYKNGNDELTYEDLILETGGYDDYNYELLNNYHNLNLTTECGDGTSTIYRFVIPETGDATLTQITTYNQGSKRDYAGEYEINKFMEQLANKYYNINN